jgi:lipoyl-dependent peroxiredoxin
MDARAFATWEGSATRGTGTITTQSGTLKDVPYRTRAQRSRSSRHADELIAAAQAACFSLALSQTLCGAGYRPRRVNTTATLTVEELPAGWTVTRVLLDVVAHVPRARAGDFVDAAVRAKTTCVICRLLNTTITLNARLVDTG